MPEASPLETRAWPKSRQQRVLATAAVAVLALGAAILAYERWPRATPPAAAAAPGTFRPTAAQLKSLTVETVATHAFTAQVRAEGRITANGDRSTQVYSPYSGRVVKLGAGIGDEVGAGAPLALVEASEWAQAQSDLLSTHAEAERSRLALERKRALIAAEGASRADLEQAEADATAARAAYGNARAHLSILGRSAGDIDAILAAGKVAPLATIAAPFAGTVVDRAVGTGQFVTAGTGAVFTLADLSSVWLLANLRESDAVEVRRGQAITAEVVALPGRVFRARVAAVAGTVDPATHRVAVRAELANGDRALKPEMFASFTIATSEERESVAVPAAALVYEGEAVHVWVVAGEVIAYRAIVTGRDAGELVEVREGLKAGERIVTRGSLFIDRAAR
jgi:membrane fusion protein, heavy metal efflux system